MRTQVRGFTLIELMVGFAIAIILTIAATEFARHETRLMGVTTNQVEAEQASRSALDLIVQDIKMAGAGIGYDNQDQFQGIYMGPTFNLGGANFGRAMPLLLDRIDPSNTPAPYPFITDDIAIRFADGSYATVVNIAEASDTQGVATVCSGPEITFESNEQVLQRSEDRLATRSLTLSNAAPAACPPDVQCTRSSGNCWDLTYLSDAIYQSASNVDSFPEYLGGEIAGGFKTVVWFVLQDPNKNSGQLRRAIFDPQYTCAARDITCGALVAENVETLLTQLWAFDPELNQWTNIQNLTAIPPERRDHRLRMDIEFVIRSVTDTGRRTPTIPLLLTTPPNNCLPPDQSGSGCSDPGGAPLGDLALRRVYRTSIEIKNSGRGHPPRSS